MAWAREGRPEDEKGCNTPAELNDYLRIAAIRKELGNDMPSAVDDEMDALEEELQEALDRINQAQPYRTDS